MMIMGKLADRDKWSVENIIKRKEIDVEVEDLSDNVHHYFTPFTPSSSFSNEFCCDTKNRNLIINNNSDDDGKELFCFNDATNLPYYNLQQQQQQQQQQKFVFSTGLCSLHSPTECSPSSSSSGCLNDRLLFYDEMGLSHSLSGLSLKNDQHNAVASANLKKGFDDFDGFGVSCFDDPSSDGIFVAPPCGGGGSFRGFDNVDGKDAFVSIGSSTFGARNQDYNNLSDNNKYLVQQRGAWSDRGILNQSHNSSFTVPYFNDPRVFSQHCKMDSNGGSKGINANVIDSLDAFQSMNTKLDSNVYNDPVYTILMLKERMKAIKNNDYCSLMSMKSEDSYIIQGNEPFNGAKMNSIHENIRGKSIRLDSCALSDQMMSSYGPFSMAPSISSLSEVKGSIYLMAQDQNGCRWLQRIFDEGTSQDIQLIFNELIDYVVELMLKPFGNYVIQKFLDVCNEEQRLQIVLMVTQEPGQLLRICLNTYGTRAVQKLIETLKTRQQISFVVMGLKPGFLELVKDQNGNHVIQRCLQCLSNEDNKFIFDAAAKFCVQIATHRHGCCVMQRCITHSTGKQREKLITEISKNALLLAQDPFGNYVVQYIVELKSPSAAVNLLSQFKRHYVHLSMQKFSSHVVEKCLKHLEESREQIVHELISVPRFEQLLQDPFANYVIQSALGVTKGPLHSSLVAAVRPHVILRTNPYSKRIFSRNLLKR